MDSLGYDIGTFEQDADEGVRFSLSVTETCLKYEITSSEELDTLLSSFRSICQELSADDLVCQMGLDEDAAGWVTDFCQRDID